MSSDIKPGVLAAALLTILLLAFAVSVDFPKASGGGFKGDEATYYVLGHSIARDFDFQYERKDLVRVWEEFRTGPQGIFLKEGKANDIRGSSGFPFLQRIKLDDPRRDSRLYFSKSYIYPLFAAPFIMLFGTNGFLVLHALLMGLNLLVAYLFLHARTGSNRIALPLAAVFLGVSVVPVYFVWLVPELFNVSLALYALFLWGYKEVARERLDAARSTFLAGPRSDYLAAMLIGIVTFSKPPHLLLVFPIVALALGRRQWRRAAQIAVLCGGVTAALFMANAAITGEFNYQGGNRKTFYADTGFPFANRWETFDNIGPVRGREGLMVGDVLVNVHSFTVFRHNVVYFLLGRNAGLVPYFLPGVLGLILFAVSTRRRSWQWPVLATIAAAVLMHLFVWPFTWNGGGGPVGSRYFLAFYPLFLLLIPASVRLGTVVLALAAGALFTAPVVLNPFYASAHPGEHAKSGPLRLLPIELTLIHDLPVAQNPSRTRRPIGGTPPMLAYFPDDNAYDPEPVPPGSDNYWFWVKGKSKAEVILRGAVASAGQDKWISKQISRLHVEVRNSGVVNTVTVSTGRESQTLRMAPGELQRISLAMRAGVPFRRDVQPTSYLYVMSVTTTNGSVPFLEIPCERPGACASDDSRFLGAMIHVIPEYTDADMSIWTAPSPPSGPRKDDSGGLRDIP
jgi:hypothetical protein